MHSGGAYANIANLAATAELDRWSLFPRTTEPRSGAAWSGAASSAWRGASVGGGAG